jgi:hypothetical protein
VEEFFLVCGVLVSLCGVMFDSSYMKNPKNTKSKRFLTYSCIVIIVISIVYFIIVFIYEICTAYRNQKARTKMHWNKLSTRSFKGISGGGKRGLVSASSQQKKKNAKVPDHDYDEVLEHLAGHATGTGAAGGSLHPAFQKLAKMQDIPDEDDDHFDDMALGSLLDEHDDDHDVEAEHEAHLASLTGNKTKVTPVQEDFSVPKNNLFKGGQVHDKSLKDF